MSRKERTVKNTITAILKYLIRVIMQFVVRTVVIYKLGVEYVGLDSLYANIISMLSLAELGIGSAIVFSMYKPASENDIEKLKSLNNFYKKMYLIIAVVVLCVGSAITPFLKHLINGEPNVDVNLYVVYGVFLLNAVISYFGAHKRSLLFVNQRNDIENNLYTIQNLVMSAVQIALLLIFKNYYLYVVMIPLFTLLETISVTLIANKLYPEIRGKAQPLDKETKKEITKNIIGASCHQLGGVIVMSTDNLLVSIFFGLTVLGNVSNYVLIYTAINSFLMLFITAMQASVGNLIATSDKERVYKNYKTFNWIFACAVGLCSICMMCLTQHFMRIWIKDSNAYLSSWILLSIVGKFYITKMRNLTNTFKNCAGLLWNDWYKPLIEVIVNIVASVLCIKWLGIAGIFVGTIISTICAPLWVEPMVLYKNYFKKSMGGFWVKYLFYTLITLIAGGASYFLCSLLPSTGILYFILKMVICVIVISVIYFISYFKTSEFKSIGGMIKSMFKGSKKKEVVCEEKETDSNSIVEE